MKKYLTISEVAKYADISRRTLIFYDEIDLFKPKKIGENGYRYYSVEQYSDLDVILTLKALDMPLADIQLFLKNRNPTDSKRELEKQQTRIHQQIKKLTRIQHSLDQYLARYKKLENIQLDTIIVEEKEAAYFVASEEILDPASLNQYQIYQAFYSYVSSEDLFSGHPIGFYGKGADLLEMPFREAPYRMLVKINKESVNTYDPQRILKRPKGLYLTGFFSDTIHTKDNFDKYFTPALEKYNLKRSGDIWELFWQDETFTTDTNEHVYEVAMEVSYQ